MHNPNRNSTVDVTRQGNDSPDMRKIALISMLCMLMTGCSTDGGSAMHAASATPDARHMSASAQRGIAFAQSHCASCHALSGNISPNPEAPPFARVVNSAGLTPGTLSGWLRNAHNFPEVMDFTIEDANIDDLSAYMLTLRDPNYRPPS